MQNATIVKDRPWSVVDFNSKGFCEIVLIDNDEPPVVAEPCMQCGVHAAKYETTLKGLNK